MRFFLPPKSTGSVSVTLLADAGVYPDWAKVGANDSAPSDGSTLGETAISKTAYDDLVGDDDSDKPLSFVVECVCLVCVGVFWCVAALCRLCFCRVCVVCV